MDGWIWWRFSGFLGRYAGCDDVYLGWVGLGWVQLNGMEWNVWNG